MTDNSSLQIGTCSWKYDSWRGIFYPEDQPINYLKEYSRHYKTVEVDQWFWSLFKGDRVVLPKAAAVREYADSVPEDFTFCIKVPNSITLTHHYRKDRNQPLTANPHFLSTELMDRFLKSIEPLQNHLGPLIFQFEYLNKQKMAHRQEFFEHFGAFSRTLPEEFKFCVETRNPNYLNGTYFDFLQAHRLSHVFLQGYYMPSIFELYEKYRNEISTLSVIRLLGPDRKGIEKESGKNWNQIVAPKDNELNKLAGMLLDLSARRVKTFAYVNNHFEGSAPRTITRIENIMK